jgi:hypothetical protein
MGTLIDETGNRYGRLLVIRFKEIGVDRHAHWECLCDCGRETIVKGASLREGESRSCGCRRIESCREELKDYREIRAVLRRTRRAARNQTQTETEQ